MKKRQSKSLVVKRLSIPLGLVITFTSIIPSTLSIMYPWSHYNQLTIHPISDISLNTLIFASILLIPIAFYLYLKRMNFTFAITSSLVIDILCSFYAMFGSNIKADLGYYLSLISSIIKGTGLLLMFLNVGVIELEIEVTNNFEKEES